MSTPGDAPVQDEELKLLHRGDVAWIATRAGGNLERWLVLSRASLHDATGKFVGVPIIKTTSNKFAAMRPTLGGKYKAAVERVRSMPVTWIDRVEDTPYPMETVEAVHEALARLTGPPIGPSDDN